MAENGTRMEVPGHRQNDWKWLEMAENGIKLAGMAGNVWKCLKMAGTCCKWLEWQEMAGNC